jgi:hypothetical protein
MSCGAENGLLGVTIELVLVGHVDSPLARTRRQQTMLFCPYCGRPIVVTPVSAINRVTRYRCPHAECQRVSEIARLEEVLGVRPRKRSRK